ncbi:sulfotransferase family 2 domain-containing protein [Nodosilinea nodulosa]|uniref:sulfotransferase family 2 domain-containing protein n=1 Tax=Nodosilinea nodulosa TaxID=416001 RepID=UPI00036EE674|nr:sulfotransferase family 2 domain-containing protein [Nodosilinea nodulosa]
MLISRKKKFVFIHIYKNAGTSISTALIRITSNKLQRYASKQLKKAGIIYLKDQPCPTHATASEIISTIGEEEFKALFSFAIVRNPWDWQVSLYHYMLQNSNHPQHKLAQEFKDFEEYLYWRCAKEIRLQKDFVCSQDDKILVDFIGRFESLDKDFQTICRRIGISACLPKVNVSNTVPYQEFYNPNTRELVRSTFEPDISLFNYSF